MLYSPGSIKPNILVCGDCLEVMAGIPDKSIDLICTDLPYGQTARNPWDIRLPMQDYVAADDLIREFSQEKERNCAKKPWLYLEDMEGEIQKQFFRQCSRPGLWSHYERVIKDHGCIILFGNGMFTADLMHSNRKLWRYNLVWHKTHPVGFLNANRMPLRSHEDLCVFYKKLPPYHPQKTDGHPRKVSLAKHQKSRDSSNYHEIGTNSYDSTERFPTSILMFANDKQRCAMHPTQKPAALIEYLIRTYTDEGGTILDSCAGVMTTAVAAVRTERKYICIEKDPVYYGLGCRRMQEEFQ